MESQQMLDKVSHISSTVSYTASGGTFLFGAYTANEVAAIGGLVFAALTFLVNLYYRHKHYQLEIERTRIMRDHYKGD